MPVWSGGKRPGDTVSGGGAGIAFATTTPTERGTWGLYMLNKAIIVPYKRLPILCRLGFHQWAPYTGIVNWDWKGVEADTEFWATLNNGLAGVPGRVVMPLNPIMVVRLECHSDHWAVWYTSQYCCRHDRPPHTGIDVIRLRERENDDK